MKAGADLLGLRVEDFLVLGKSPRYASARNGRYILGSAPPPLPPAQPRRRRKSKYRHPDEPELTWAGTGFIPVWLREEIEAGGSLGRFLVAGARVTAAAARQEQEIRDRVAGA